MNAPIKIAVACGSGVATSTVAVQEVKEILKEAGITADIIHCSLAEIPVKEDFVDIILTTNNYRKECKKPVLSVFGLIAGINTDKIKADIIALCNQAIEKQ